MKLSNFERGAIRRSISAIGKAVGFDVLTMWRETSPETRTMIAAGIDMLAHSRALLPPSPPAELATHFAAAAAAADLPPELLHAMSWELARYGEAQQTEQTAGVIALPAAAAADRTTAEQVHACAQYLRREISRSSSFTGPVVAYAGDLELARRVLGTCAFLLTQRIAAELPENAGTEAIALLEEIAR